jgi:hypothetical protein
MAFRHLGRLTGTGRVIAAGYENEIVRYEIDIVQDGATKSGHGMLHGDRVESLASSAPMCDLVLSDGRKVTVFLTGTDPTSGYAHIRTSGPVPGF